MFCYEWLLLKKDTQPEKLFSFRGKTFLAKCVSVYDGDTITVKFFYRRELITYKLRLMGIDTPELRSYNELEKNLSQKIKKIVNDLLLNKIIKIKCYEFDKYGRILGDIYVYTSQKEICLNEYLLSNKLAVPYDGKTKKDFDVIYYNQNPNIILSQDYPLWKIIIS